MNIYNDYKDFELIELFCENNDLRYSPYYSGRFMFGRDCVGIVTDHPLEDYGKLVSFMKEYGRTLPRPSQDNMGLSTIIYWTDIQDTRAYDEDDNVIGYNRLELEDKEE